MICCLEGAEGPLGRQTSRPLPPAGRLVAWEWAAVPAKVVRRRNDDSLSGRPVECYIGRIRIILPSTKPTTAFSQLQVIDSNFADPEIAVRRAAALHRSPPTTASVLSGTYHTLGPLTLWEV